MKIAVYTIALNEEAFVERWAKSAKEADYLFILDTGSTDRTIELAKELGVHVHSATIKPWRFDVARNVALSLLPANIDYCIALDMDEILIPGWRKELTKVDKKVTRPRYKYTWSWNSDGTPGLQYGGDKIHSRTGYRWKHPVHEVITVYGMDEVQSWTNLEIHHHPDDSKSRAQYLPLLEMSVREDPHDERNAYYYARELFFWNHYEAAKKEFERYLALPTAHWKAERAAAYRYLSKVDPKKAERHLIAASIEAPEHRESWVELAQHYYQKSNWKYCYNAAKKALEIKEKPLAYLNEAWAWGALPHDLAALAAFHIGEFKEAVELGKEALAFEPQNERLISNLAFYEQAVK
jgi:tetratricopeptide (TPR) repeat protein